MLQAGLATGLVRQCMHSKGPGEVRAVLRALGIAEVGALRGVAPSSGTAFAPAWEKVQELVPTGRDVAMV